MAEAFLEKLDQNQPALWQPVNIECEVSSCCVINTEPRIIPNHGGGKVLPTTPENSKLPMKRARSRKPEDLNAPITPDSETPVKKRRKYRTQKQVHTFLKNMGVENPEEASCCIKEGIRKEFIKLLLPKEDPHGIFGLDQVLCTGSCDLCSHHVTAKLRDALFQGNIGIDFKDGAPDSKVRCSNCNTGYYVKDVCRGNPKLDNGECYNHCLLCPAFGRCIGDYRMSHCPTCKSHYNAGGMGEFGCKLCNP